MMLLAAILAIATERTTFPPADSVVPLPERNGVMIQRGDEVALLPMDRPSPELPFGKHSALRDHTIQLAFSAAGRLFVKTGEATLYDLKRRTTIAFPAKKDPYAVLRIAIGPNEDAAIVESGSNVFWWNLANDKIKTLPSNWIWMDEFARSGSWAVFVESTDPPRWNSTRAVAMATGELIVATEPPPSPGISVDLDVGETFLPGRVIPTVEEGYIPVPSGLGEEIPRPTKEEAASLPTEFRHESRAFKSMDTGRFTLVQWHSAISENELGHCCFSEVPYRVKRHTLLVDRDGTRYELTPAITADAEVWRLDSTDSKEIYKPTLILVHDSGTIVTVTTKSIERIVPHFPETKH